MSDFLGRISQFSPKRLALLADELQGRLEALEASRRAPIAIVGIGCRLPGGADTPERFWTHLLEGRDAIVQVPVDRWSLDEFFDPDPDAPGRMSTRWGGFLASRVDGFDPHFFGISPREAQGMDPQQRLLLEVTWEALEHAGIPADRLAGTRTAVFVGMSASDYFHLMRAGGLQALDAYTASGTAHSVASGRLSYVLGLQGPSLSIDTACSSSLVAIHEAVHSLRRGECSLALAGGVNLMLMPDVTIALSKAHMMAPDGRCKTFDARADGFVRGEGCGVLVLKRLADAQADGNRIVAVIRGSAANQDGRSNGLTAPNGPAQEAVMRDALADAGVAPRDIGYVEAHGTGTSLGDPIEVQAIARVLGEGRPAGDAVVLGSVKASIGHLEAAAGVAGVIKLALALQHREIPAQLHFERPNPAVPWPDLPVRVAASRAPWPAPEAGVRLGGISSFGFSGTNVHLVLEEAPEATGALVEEVRPLHLLTASARHPAALRELIAGRAAALREGTHAMADVAYAANAGRVHFAHRAVVVAASTSEAAARLETYLSGEPAPGVQSGVAGPRPPRIAFLFTGQGSQYAGMARTLYETQPVFRSVIDRCDELLGASLPVRLRDVLLPAPGAASPIDRTEYTQPALFAMEFALASLWMSWGVRPTAVLGHSVGEYVAASVAGVFSMEDGLALVAERGRLMGALPPGGAMAAVLAGETVVRDVIAPWASALSLAAVNGPLATVVSGDGQALASARARLERDGLKVTPLNVSHAFHSPLVEPMLAAFAATAARTRFVPPVLDLVSNVTGELAGAGVADPSYWCEHVRAPVRFADGMHALARAGCDVFLEVGPHPVLLGMGRDCLPDHPGAWLPSLRRGRGDWDQLLESLATLYVRGVSVDWTGVEGGAARRPVTLPTYPFQRERYWVRDNAQAAASTPSDRLPSRVRDLLYEVAWRDAADAASSLPGPNEIATRLEPALRMIAAYPGLAAYDAFLPALDALATAYVVAALRQLGLPLREGDIVPREGLAARLGVLPRHGQLVERMLEMLVEDGILRAEDHGWRVAGGVAMDPETMCASMFERFPTCEAELEVTQACGARLAEVLRGGADPLALLFPGGSLERTERIYGGSPPAQAFNRLVGEVVRRAVEEVPTGRPLRVLEIGAGSGSTTAEVLAHLPAGRTLYTFSDVSPLFLNRARERFGGGPGMEFRLLDVASDPLGQGFTEGGFDIVIAANVLHATPDLGVTLRHVRRLLAHGGLLVLLEATAPQRFGDLTVGLLDGWWAFTDVARRGYALMPAPSWLSLLEETGFDAPIALPGDTGVAVLSQQAVFVARAGAERTAGEWLVLPDAGGVADALAEVLRASGDSVTFLPRDPEAVPAALRDALAATPGTRGVVHLGALDAQLDDATTAERLLADQEWLVRRTLALVQGLAAAGDASPPPVRLVTRGAQAVRAGDGADPAQAVLWGLSHVIALEHPELHATRLDLDPAWEPAVAARALAAELGRSGPEDQIALRGDRRLARRLVRRAAGSEPLGAVPVLPREDRSYLVTGGLRGLGLRTAEWLVERGARHIALNGRRAPDATTMAAIARMEMLGARVLVVPGDIAVREDVERALATIAQELPPLAGVVHAAGVLDDASLASQRWERFATVMAPKVLGTWHLHLLAPDLDFLVLYSSGASVAGSAGQANHAAANAFEDAFAWYRQARGRPTLSLNWGPWAEIGAAVERRVPTDGLLRAMSPEDGLAALAHAMQRVGDGGAFATPQLVVIAADWSRLAAGVTGGRLAALFDELAAQTGATPAASVGTTPSPSPAGIRERLRAVAPNRRRAVLRDHVRDLTVRVLGLARANDLDLAEPLQQLGLDSLMAVELRNRLGDSVGRTLPATLTFDHPSVLALADHLASDVLADELPRPGAPAELPGAVAPSMELTEDDLVARLTRRLDAFQPGKPA